MTRVGIVTWPGSDARATARAVRLAGGEPVDLPHDAPDLADLAAVVLPGGAACPEASALWGPLAAAAADGLPVLGVGEGFAALCAAGLLPGEVVRHDGALTCRDETLRVETRDTVWTCSLDQGQTVTLPVVTASVRYVADGDTLARLEGASQVVLRRPDADATGSAYGIAGLTNERGNVVGLLGRPDLAVEALTGPSEDGRAFFTSGLTFVLAAS